MRSHELRELYLGWFERRSHLRLPSSSLVPPAGDRSVLLTTAGMQQFKPYFEGAEQPPSRRVTTVQKVFRTVDLDTVGTNVRSLTFFEMMGNFSFGDYFKPYAIQNAWELVTSPAGYGLDPDRIWVTVYRGDERVGADDEAAALWVAQGVPGSRVVRLGGDNFWGPVGDTGPCGPCSELYYDRGAEYGCGRDECAPGCDCDRFLEFWNLVFMQYNQLPGGGLEPLPAPCVDTGSGVERTAMLLQGAESVYHTDAFGDIIAVVEGWSGARYGRSDPETKALRVLADHGRAMTFLATDGVEPGNEGREYVLRRVIRRAVLHGRRIGIEGAFLGRLQGRVCELLQDAYPELGQRRAAVEAVLAEEERRFDQTLATGGALLDQLLAEPGDRIAATDAFKLHDTYGFPFELTAEIAAEQGKRVDETGFAELMSEQRERSRADAGHRPAAAAAGFARDAGRQTEFVGYEHLAVTTGVLAVLDQPDGTVLLKLRESPFYARGGGQVADTGTVESETARAVVQDVLRLDSDQVLVVRMERGAFAAGERVRAHVSGADRRPTMANHTATHLLHAALREVLGDHVTQAGSYVGPDKLRFDFRHGQPLSPEEVERVERIVNLHVIENHPLHIFVTSRDHARTLGAMMLFGEKYGDHVRVVEVPGVSRELCGGTHVRSTAEIGPFVLTRETSSSQGVRRVEAITAGAATEHLRARAREADRLAHELAEREAELRRARSAGPVAATAAPGNGHSAGLAERAVDEAGVQVVAAVLDGADADALLAASDAVKSKLSPAAVVLGSAVGGRVHLVANFDQPAVERGLSAVDVVREVAPLFAGGGGGRPTMARAGGADPDGLEPAVDAARRAIVERLRGA